jgi:hypothetical protein
MKWSVRFLVAATGWGRMRERRRARGTAAKAHFVTRPFRVHTVDISHPFGPAPSAEDKKAVPPSLRVPKAALRKVRKHA